MLSYSKSLAMGLGIMALAAAPASQSAGGTPHDGVRELLAMVQKELSACEKGECDSFAADVWALRKRVATTEELRSMAVQVEQGDEACLCGKTSPTVTAIDRQAQLLAEAVLLYKLCGDLDGARFCLNRLRNVAAKEPANLGVAELLVRSAALLDGADAGVKETATLSPANFRAHVLISASESSGLDPDVRAGLLKGVGDVGMDDKAAFLRAMERAGKANEADAFIDNQPVAERGKLRLALSRLRRDRTKATDPAALSKALASTDAIAIARAAEENGPNLSLEKTKQIASSLGPGAPRVGFLIGTMRGMTKSSDRIRYEDFLIVHPGPGADTK